MKTKTVYIPLEEGEVITADCVYFSDQSNIPESAVAFSGVHYMPDIYCPFFRPIEIPAELVEPKEDPYKALKEAFAEGKIIQWNQNHGTVLNPNWLDSDLTPDYPPDAYRIKPEPVRVPLGPEDVPPGSVFRPTGNIHWKAMQGPTSHGVVVAFVGTITWDELLKRYETSRDFGKTWHPCWKEVAQ